MSALGFKSTHVECPKCGEPFPAWPVGRERFLEFERRCHNFNCRESSVFTRDDLIQSVCVG